MRNVQWATQIDGRKLEFLHGHALHTSSKPHTRMEILEQTAPTDGAQWRKSSNCSEFSMTTQWETIVHTLSLKNWKCIRSQEFFIAVLYHAPDRMGGKIHKGGCISVPARSSNMPIVTEKNHCTTLGKLHAQKIKQSQFATTDTAIRDHGNFRSNPWSRTIGDLCVSSVVISYSKICMFVHRWQNFWAKTMPLSLF